jgi:hypothetical protein
MTNKAQIEMAKAFWEHSRTAAQQAYEAWGLLIQSQKTLIDSMRNAGIPFEAATDQYEKLMQFHGEQYKNALAFMDKMADEYRTLLTK